MWEAWGDEEDRKKFTAEQRDILNSYVDNLHFLKVEYLSPELREKTAKEVEYLEPFIDEVVRDIIKDRVNFPKAKTTRFKDIPQGEEQKKFVIKIYAVFISSVLCIAIASYIAIRFDFQFSWWWVMVEVLAFLLCAISGKTMLREWACVTGFSSVPIVSRLYEGDLNIIWQALLTTSLLFTIFSLYLFYTRKNFDRWGGILFMSFIILITALICLLVLPGTLIVIVSSVGILLYCSFVIYNTSNVISKHSLEEADIAACKLHLDFLLLFFHWIVPEKEDTY